MKDFTLNKKEKETYIKKVRKAKNKSGISTYEITFADGRKFKNITCAEENLEKIIHVQEEQAKKAINNKGVFEKREQKLKFTTLTGIVLTGLLGIGAAPNIANGNVIESLCIIPGTITLAASTISFFKYLVNKGKVAELSKINYRNQNQKELSKFKEYENSLTGLTKSKEKFFDKSSNPLSIVEIDNYKEEDLKKIMSNIEREKTYKFTYQK